jgi:hypothetical protein
MVAATLVNPSVTPPVVGNLIGSHYRPALGAKNTPTLRLFARHYGLHVRAVGRSLQAVRRVVRSGGLGVILVGYGYFTGSGHYMVVRGVNAAGHFVLADPRGAGLHGDSEKRGFTSSFFQYGAGRLVAAWTFK